MKILAVIDGYGWCGTKEQTYLITKGLSEYYNIELALAFHHSDMINKLKDKVVLRFYEKGSGYKKRFLLRNYLRLYDILKKGNYDIIIPHSSWAFNYIVFIYPFLSKKKPKIISIRRSQKLPSFISKHGKYNIASKIVVVSREIAKKLKNRNFFPEKLVVIESGVDLSKFKPSFEYRYKIREELKIKDNEKVFINAAYWSPQTKGQDVLLKAFKKTKDCKLILVGDKTDSKEAKSFIENLGLRDRVITLGFRYDIEHLFQACDYFVLSSNVEGISGVLLQAMASGKVVLSTLAGGIGEYLKDGINGFTVAPKDIEALSEKMRKMLSLKEDEYKNLSSKAQETAQQYSIETTIKKWRNLIEEITR